MMSNASTSPLSGAPTIAPGSGPDDQQSVKPMRRILVSSFLGTTFEYYDFLLYTVAAAAVFPYVFFAGLDPAIGALLSYITLAVGYAARPLGGILFGHFGDRLGRKGVLVVTMVMMGGATILIGLLPTTAQIGPAAAIILVVLRVFQGLAAGGEWGGATLIALEHAPGGRRGFAASFASIGLPIGGSLGALALSVMSLLPPEQFLAWGWRVPFVASVVLLAVALVIRLNVSESPLFRKFDSEAHERRVPIVEVFRTSTRGVILGLLVVMSQLTVAGMVTAWGVGFAIAQGADRSGVLATQAAAALAMFVTAIVSARLSDRLGRKPVMAAGIIAIAVCAFPVLLLLQTGTVWGYAVAAVLALAAQGIVLGPAGAFLAELFPTSVRFTGASIAFQGASTLGAGLTPVVAATIVAAGGGVVALGVAWVAALAVSLLALVFSREGRDADLTAPAR